MNICINKMTTKTFALSTSRVRRSSLAKHLLLTHLALHTHPPHLKPHPPHLAPHPPHLQFQAHLDDIMIRRVVLVAVSEHQTDISLKFLRIAVLSILHLFLSKEETKSHEHKEELLASTRVAVEQRKVGSIEEMHCTFMVPRSIGSLMMSW